MPFQVMAGYSRSLILASIEYAICYHPFVQALLDILPFKNIAEYTRWRNGDYVET